MTLQYVGVWFVQSWPFQTMIDAVPNIQTACYGQHPISLKYRNRQFGVLELAKCRSLEEIGEPRTATLVNYVSETAQGGCSMY